MRILFAAAPGYGMMLPVVPLVWAARAAGHEILVATTAYMTRVGPQCGLPIVDVFPARDVGADLMLAAAGNAPADDDPGDGGSPAGDPAAGDPAAGDPAAGGPAAAAGLPEGYWAHARALQPFELFTLAMTGGTITAGREFGADLLVYTSDHAAGALAAVALDLPALEVGNRVSWSVRDADFRDGAGHNARTGYLPEDSPVVRGLRERLGLGARRPDLVARIDPRAPSMGGLAGDEPDPRDGVPWWPMRYVPYNGGAVLPGWALRRPARPRVCLTLGTVTPLLSDGGLLARLAEALGALDVEVVLADHSTDLGRLGPLPDNVHPAGFLPLSGFLPSCSVVVHHGGSGTTAAALYYGVPQLVLPEGADNPLVARRVVDRKVGLALDPAGLTGPALGTTVRRLLDDPAFTAAAAEVRAEIATQPSPASVVDRTVRALAGRWAW